MDLSLEQRLLRFLTREEDDERRASSDLRALSIEERVLEGECIQDAVFERVAGGSYTFSVAENVSKFRSGDGLLLGDGADFESAQRLAYVRYDAAAAQLVLGRDRFARGDDPAFEVGASYCIDRRPLGLRGRLQDVVRAGFANPVIAEVLSGSAAITHDEQRRQRARAHLRARGLNPSQVEAGAQAIASHRLGLIQGPPGTGKTRLLAEMLRMLCGAGCRIALTAFTHRAVDNVLHAVRALDPELPLVKLGYQSARDASLRAAGVSLVEPRQAGSLPAHGVVIAGTCFALAKLPWRHGFHYTVVDEAAQLPLPHALVGMLLSPRWIFLGDHRQLPPVVTADHHDREVTRSVFELLDGHYHSHMLDVTYRMNESICGVVSELFYAGALSSAPAAATRRMPFVSGGVLDEVLDPERPAVLARVDHLQPGRRSPEEAHLVADLVAELCERHGLEPAQIAVVTPFRAQVRAIRTALQCKNLHGLDQLTVETIERIQGQEREVVIVSLAVGDPESLRRASFFFSANRLNVALSRARSKVIVVAARGAFSALPMEPESLRAAASFHRLYGMLPHVDLTSVYAMSGVSVQQLS